MNEKSFLTEGDLAPLCDTLAKANTEFASALIVTSRQAVAGMLVQALLVREMARAGLIDVVSLQAEALALAENVGEPVAAVVRDIIGGHVPSVPEIKPQPPFTVIHGGRGD